MFTPGNVDDREPLYSESFIKNIKGKLCGDKGYIGKQQFEFLFMNGVQLVTKVKINMKNSLMSVSDKIILRKRTHVNYYNNGHIKLKLNGNNPVQYRSLYLKILFIYPSDISGSVYLRLLRVHYFQNPPVNTRCRFNLHKSPNKEKAV